jgi:hypothetical protein
MPDYYYATIIYPSGAKCRLVHKGKLPTAATMTLLGRINASIEVGEPVPPDMAHDAEIAELAILGMRRLRAQAQLDVPEDDDD